MATRDQGTATLQLEQGTSRDIFARSRLSVPLQIYRLPKFAQFLTLLTT